MRAKCNPNSTAASSAAHSQAVRASHSGSRNAACARASRRSASTPANASAQVRARYFSANSPDWLSACTTGTST